MIRKTTSQYECCKSMLTANIFVKRKYKTLTKRTVECYTGVMFMQIEQATKHPEVGP